MKRSWLFILCPVLTGCLASAPTAPTHWTIDLSRVADAADPSGGRLVDTLRISSVDVRPPYSGQRLVVLRPDGSVAFDAFHAFASGPQQLLRGMARDVADASGRFGRVLEIGTAAAANADLETVVTQMALDCRQEGKRTARVAVTLLMLKSRVVIASATGEGTCDAEKGDYSAAFSSAFAQAMRRAIDKLSLK